MPSLNRIVAATDLSAPARHAAERAALLAAALARPLGLLHVADLTPLERLRQLMGETPEQLQQRVLGAAQRRLDELAASLQQRWGVTADAQVASGRLLQTLMRALAADASDLLVCGARGESFVRHLALGTTALRVLSVSTTPVLIVKQAPREAWRRLLVPVDFSTASLQAIHLARRVAPDAGIVLLHAFDLPYGGKLRYAGVDESTVHRYMAVARQEALQKLQALRDEAGLSTTDTTLVVQHGDPSVQIIEQEQEFDCDLIVMGKHGANATEELLLGSVTRRVLADCNSDLLVCAARAG